MPLSKMDDITPETLFDAVKSLSPKGRAELMSYLRATAIELDPESTDPAANRARLLAAFTLEALKLAEEKGLDAVRDAEQRLQKQLQA